MKRTLYNLAFILTLIIANDVHADEIQAVEVWRADISIDSDTRTQAVGSDSIGNSYVAGVSNSGVSYARFVQKLDSAGAEDWRFESSLPSDFRDIVHQQLVVDEADGALYVLRSNMDNISSHLISVAKHSLSDGDVVWNVSAGLASVPAAMIKSAALGVGTDGAVWVARQYETHFAFDDLRWSIQYRKLDAATGAELGDGLLAAGSLTDRFLYDLSTDNDRLFVAYRQQGPTDFDLVITGYDISTGSLVIVNPHEPSPCSSTAPCRQEFNFSIPDSTNGTATFTDAAFDANGNFAVAGYYEFLELDDCLPECFGGTYWYYPVVVKVDRTNQVLFEAIEQGSSGGRYSTGSNPSSAVTASVAAAGGDWLLVLVAEIGGIVMELDQDGFRADSWRLPSYVNESFSAGGCSFWAPLWQPRALTAAPGARLVITGQLPATCIPGGFVNDLDTSRTVSFSDVGVGPVDLDGDGFSLADGDCDDGDPLVFPGAIELCDLADNNCDTTVDEGFSFGCEHVSADVDGDALLDKWERLGIDFEGDGVVDVDLPSMGASAVRKDVFVEVDYMEDTGTTNPHSDAFSVESLTRVAQAYLDAPVANLDGSTGISLHIDAGPHYLMDPLTGATWGTLSEANAVPHLESFGVNSSPSLGDFLQARRQVFHYATAAHNLPVWSIDTSCSPAVIVRFNGLSLMPGQFFTVTQGEEEGQLVDLGGFVPGVRDVVQEAGLFMHELGHNMGLGHGGWMNHDNRKPHYFSVMNYSFSYRGLNIDGMYGHQDYARFDSVSLDETMLDESIGIGDPGLSGRGLGTIRYCPFGGSLNCVPDPGMVVIEEPDAAAPMDWNCNGIPDATGIVADINLASPPRVLTATSDWDKLVFDGGGSLGALAGAGPPVVPEIPDEPTDQELEALLPKPFAVDVAGQGIVMLAPGSSTAFEFAVLNDGDNPDTYLLEAKSDGFADTDGVPSSVTLLPGEVWTVSVPVVVAATASRGDRDAVSLRAQSQSNLLMAASARTVALVSDFRPVANAVASLPNAGMVHLDGTNSTSPSGAPLSYLWTGPFAEGDGVSTQATPTVTLPEGTHLITLVVNDGVVDSAPDTVVLESDNCPDVSNPDQVDTDTDGQGDACDADDDNDGCADDVDTAPLTFSADGDGDGNGNDCDICPIDPLNDIDGDGVCGNVDNCPVDANSDQADLDSDGDGNVCDLCPNDPLNDADGDSVCGDVDLCSGSVPDTGAGVPSKTLRKNHWADIDGDGIFDTSGNNPTDRSFSMQDTAGCSCAQIIDACGYGLGHRKFGCSNGVMDTWTGLFDAAGGLVGTCEP